MSNTPEDTLTDKQKRNKEVQEAIERLWIELDTKNDESIKLPENETALVFSTTRPPREILRFVPTETGFYIKIGDGIEPTEAAKQFIAIVMELMGKHE